MTTATVAPVSGNGFAVLLAIFLLVSFITCVVLWVHEQRSDKQGDTIAEQGDTLQAHTEQLATLAYQMPALLEFLGIEIPAPVEDDSPAALEEEFDPAAVTIEPPPNPTKRTIATVPYPADCPTDEIPVAPATVPDGMPLVVQSALLRPSPVPRGKSAEWVEEAIKGFNFTGRDR